MEKTKIIKININDINSADQNDNIYTITVFVKATLETYEITKGQFKRIWKKSTYSDFFKIDKTQNNGYIIIKYKTKSFVFSCYKRY